MSSSNFFQQFNENKLKGNTSKYHLLLSSDENIDPNIGTSQIKNSNYEKLFRVNIDSNLSFENHINLLSTKARARFLNKGKRKLLMKPFFKYQFSYCSLSWLFLSFTLNNISVKFWKYIIHFPSIIEIYRSLLQNYIKLVMFISEAGQ